MAAAADRDRIAHQYSNGFADIFDRRTARTHRRIRPVGRPEVGDACGLSRVPRGVPRHATSCANTAPRVAEEVRRDGARSVARRCTSATSPTHLLERSHGVGRSHSRQRGINPGTSADLTVATLFAAPASEHLADAPATVIDFGRGEAPPLSGQPVRLTPDAVNKDSRSAERRRASARVQTGQIFSGGDGDGKDQRTVRRRVAGRRRQRGRPYRPASWGRAAARPRPRSRTA